MTKNYFLGCNCLHLAAQFGHTSIVAYFIALGQEINAPDANGMTALMWSAFRVTGYDTCININMS